LSLSKMDNNIRMNVKKNGGKDRKGKNDDKQKKLVGNAGLSGVMTAQEMEAETKTKAAAVTA